MKKHTLIVLLVFYAYSAVTQAQNEIPELKWLKDLGSKSFPTSHKTYYANDFGAMGDAMMNCTEAIQKAIDTCAAYGGGKVSFHPGIYITGSLFIKSNVNLQVPRGTTLQGSLKMNWPAALLNSVGQEIAYLTTSV